MASTMTTSVAGMRPPQRPRPNSRANAAAPNAVLYGLALAALLSRSSAMRGVSLWCTVTSRIFGNCLMAIVSASPKVNPRSTGRAMKSDMPPSRPTPARMNSSPVAMMSAAASVSAVPALPGSESTVANSTAADEDVADTIAKRLDPTSAYTTSPDNSAINPACGGRLAMPAYATASGNSRPAIENPAITSRSARCCAGMGGASSGA